MIESFLRQPRNAADYAADTMRALGLVSVIAAAIWSTPTDAGILAFALPALLLPRFVGARPWFDIVFSVAVLIAAWSNLFDLYEKVAGWDLAVHFVCTGLIAAMVYLLLATFGIVPRPRSAAFAPRIALVMVTTLGLAIGALWEMVEWVGLTFFSDEIIVTYVDTIADMAIGGLGALAAGVLVAYVDLERAES